MASSYPLISTIFEEILVQVNEAVYTIGNLSTFLSWFSVSNSLSGNGLDVEVGGSLRGSGEADRRVDRIPPAPLKQQPNSNDPPQVNKKSHEEGSHDLTEEHLHSLVDCGGRDLGFCDMNSRYPG